MLLKEIHDNEWLKFFYTSKGGNCPYCNAPLRPWWGCTYYLCQFSIESSKLDPIREQQYSHLMRFIFFLKEKKMEHYNRIRARKGMKKLKMTFPDNNPL